MVDTNVFIHSEKLGQPLDLSGCDQSESICISVITASELFVGVQRANSEERRIRRSQFVETIISSVEIIEFTLGCARKHAEIYADLAVKGQLIGAHDLIIAATARYHDIPILTDNFEEFSRVTGLKVIRFGA